MAKFCVKSAKQQHQRGQPLLPVNHFHPSIVFIFEGDNWAEKVLAVAIELRAPLVRDSKGKDIVPQSLTLGFSPGIGPLVIWDQKI